YQHPPQFAAHPLPSILLRVVLVVAPFVICSFILIAALKMKRLEAYPAAIAASILAMFVTPGNLVGLPIGVWSLTVLLRREVKQQFQKQRVPAAAIPAASARMKMWPWFLGAAALILLTTPIFL